MNNKKMIAKLILCSLISIEMFTINNVEANSHMEISNEKYIIAKNDKKKATKEANNEFKIEKYGHEFGYQFIELPREAKASNIKSFSMNSNLFNKEENKISIFGKSSYAIEGNKIYINPLKENDIITINYNDNIYNFKYSKNGDMLTKISDSEKEIPYQIRLKGAFEPALINQRKYDGISAATMSSSNHKNSNVVLEATDKKNPTEDDWKALKEFPNLKVKTKTMDGQSGMNVVYNDYDSSITLNGTPSHYGKFPAKVTVTDQSGKIYESNNLDFSIYGLDEELYKQMNVKNFKQTDDGKYMWDMEPWYMEKFGDDEVVNVPKDLKAIFGSHTSGVYGVLGTADKDKVQTLIVGGGSNLTIQNMKILSSVKIIVKDGGRLNLRDSSIYGKVEVHDGSTLVINYDEFHKKFLNGTSINGQIELKEGATLENSLVYSNTNSLTDSKVANKNVEAVVIVTGDANIKGDVYIRGDESPSGDDPLTNKVYRGQKAITVKNAKLNIEKDSTLGAYGGGRFATTSMGANAVTLDGGTIKGDGKLIAIGGAGATFEGGSAVAGSGSIENDEVYMVAGITYNKNAPISKAYDKDVEISKTTTGFAKDSKYVKTSTDFDQPGYWKDSQRVPSESLIEYEKDSFTYNDEKVIREPKQKDHLNEEDDDKEIDNPIIDEENDKNKDEDQKPIENSSDNENEDLDKDDKNIDDEDNSDEENNEDESKVDQNLEDEKKDESILDDGIIDDSMAKENENTTQLIFPNIDNNDKDDIENGEEKDDSEINSIDIDKKERNKLLYNKLKTALDKYKTTIEKLKIYKEIYNNKADKKEKISQTIEELLIIADRIIERGNNLLERLSR